MNNLFQTYPYAKIALESVLAGVIMILFVYASAYVISFSKGLKPTLPEICSSWNKNYIMEITVFLAGFGFWIAKYAAQRMNWIN